MNPAISSLVTVESGVTKIANLAKKLGLKTEKTDDSVPHRKTSGDSQTKRSAPCLEISQEEEDLANRLPAKKSRKEKKRKKKSKKKSKKKDKSPEPMDSHDVVICLSSATPSDDDDNNMFSEAEYFEDDDICGLQKTIPTVPSSASAGISGSRNPVTEAPKRTRNDSLEEISRKNLAELDPDAPEMDFDGMPPTPPRQI